MAWTPTLSVPKKATAWEPTLPTSYPSDTRAPVLSLPIDTAMRGSTPAVPQTQKPNQSFLSLATETIRGLPAAATQVGTAIGKGAVALGQGVMQGYGATGAFLAAGPSGIKHPETQLFQPQPEDTFLGQLERNLYGTDKPFGFGQTGSIPVVAPENSPQAVALGVTFSAMDLFGAGGAAKQTLKGLITALRLTKDTVEGAAEATRLLRVAGFADDIARDYGVAFSKLTDDTLIEKGLHSAETLHNTTKVAGAAKPTVQTTERGFISSVKEANPEIASRVAGQYVPRETDTLATQAANLVKDDITTAENLARTGTSDKSVATAAELIKHYTNEAATATNVGIKNTLYDKAADIANTIARKLTEQGRAVQAASILGRLTPEGVVRFAAREIQKYNEAIDTAKTTLGGINPTAMKTKIPELTGEQVAGFTKQAKEIASMPDGVEKAMAWHKLNEGIAALIPSGLYAKLVSVWKAGLLTGVKTSGLNIASNLFHGVSEIVKDVPAAAVDSIAALFTGKRTLALTGKGTGTGLVEGLRKGWRYLKTGFDERDIAGKLDLKKVNFGTSKVAKAIQAYEETIFRIIGAEDQPFYYGAKARSLYSQAIAMVETSTRISAKFGNKALSPELKAIENQAFFQGAQRGDKGMIKDYINQFGKTINTDNARELYSQYVADRSLSAGVHEPASRIAKLVYKTLLRTSKNIGDRVVLFTGGGTGAGKSSALKDIPLTTQMEKNASIVYDTNLDKTASAVTKIEQALKAGYDVNIVYVYRDPVEAFANGTLTRADRMGRTVPIAEHANTHFGIPPTAMEIMDIYKNDHRVKIHLIDNSLGENGAKLVEDPLAFLKQKGYTKLDEKRITDQLTRVLEEKNASGAIKPGTYAGTKGQRVAGNGSGVGGQLESQYSQKNAVEQLVSHPTDEMLKYAAYDAETAVFQNKTALGTAAKSLQRIPGGELVVPFSKTPSAVAMQVLNYSPLGIVKTLAENIGKGKFDQRLFSQNLGRNLVGTGIMYLGYKMFDSGIVSLGRPTSEKDIKQWELEGRSPNSILIDGKWRSANVLGPAGFTLILGGYLAQGIKQTGSVTQGVLQMAAGLPKTLTDQTFLRGLDDFVSAIKDPVGQGKNYFAGLIGSIVPTIVGDVARSTDSVERRTPGILDRAQSRIPGAREQLQPQVDVFGQENKIDTNIVETMADPTRPSTVSNDPVVLELRRLTDAGFQSTPTLLGDKNGFPKALTPEQNTELWKRVGELLKGKLDSLIQTTQYKQMDDEQKQKTIQQFTDKAKVNARAEMVVSLALGLSGAELKAELSKLKAGGLLTKEVLNKYAEIR